MQQSMESREFVLVEEEAAGERRVVTLVEGESLALIERSSGPLTQVAYGAYRHGHKMLCDYEKCARVLGVQVVELRAKLTELFAQGDAAWHLSDVMDRFDVAGENYTYIAWTGEGDVAMRTGVA